ncbi:hypothetical protein ACE1OC_42045 (plasmid) [Streptomyces sp. DSM 116496]|uniref:hypothetical protein n=1 Tax=Streptomyces stoeckheimensis TaxID=3344656 RepID=UPI0038B24C79
MPTHLTVSISMTQDAPSSAAPETTAVRLVSCLPASWTVVPLSMTTRSATLSLTAPDGTRAPAVLETLDTALSAPAFTGWIRG